MDSPAFGAAEAFVEGTIAAALVALMAAGGRPAPGQAVQCSP